jgi:hypothetical protein
MTRRSGSAETLTAQRWVDGSPLRRETHALKRQGA